MEENKLIKNNVNLQDTFLNYVRKEHIQITIYLLNGYQLKGLVKGFDNYTIVIQTIDHKQQLIYKHGISTISPIRPIEFPNINNIKE